MADQKEKSFYVVHYRDPHDGKSKELKARSIKDSSLGLSFVCISDFVFDQSTLVLNPAEEEQKKRLENVKSLHLSMYTILSIEERGFENVGLSFENDKSNLVVLPQQPASLPPQNPS